MDVLAIMISSLALIFSIVQFIKDNSRAKKEATLIAYNRLQDDVFSELTKYSYPMPNTDIGSEEWNELTVYLAKIEQFSVGINTRIYSIAVLNRLGGAFFVRQFEKLEPIIAKKRKESRIPGSHYEEFEMVVKHLRNRNKR